METAISQDPQHPIQVVSRRTGLTADVIRAWERRYGAVAPRRSGANRRLYSDAEIERLLLLRRAIRGGRRIGDVAAMAVDELVALVESDTSSVARAPDALTGGGGEPHGSHVHAALVALDRVDAASLESVLTRAALEFSPPDLIREVLVPLMYVVGDRWHEKTMSIHQEHLATAGVRSLLETLRSSHARRFSGPDIVVCTAAGQLHEIGALLVAVMAACDSWRVTYLGANLPVGEIARAVQSTGARALGLSLVYPPDDPLLLADLRRLGELLPEGVAILVGGASADSYLPVIEEIDATCLHDLSLLRSELKRLHENALAPPGRSAAR